MKQLKHLLREPLVQFLLLGSALFALYGAVKGNHAASQADILITPGQIEHLTLGFAGTWHRPPTSDELRHIVDDYVREEVLSREAIRLGLDQNDEIIRRRLQQKMEFIAADIAAVTEPTEEQLADYLAKHPDEFRSDPLVTFRQVFLNPDTHGDNLDHTVTALLARLQIVGADADISSLGDPTMIQSSFRDEPSQRIETDFGSGFAASLASAPPGKWIGPVVSVFGTHIVFVEKRTEGHVPVLDDVRPQVRREWENARRTSTDRAFFDELLKRYSVTIEWPNPQVAEASLK